MFEIGLHADSFYTALRAITSHSSSMPRSVHTVYASTSLDPLQNSSCSDTYPYSHLYRERPSSLTWPVILASWHSAFLPWSLTAPFSRATKLLPKSHKSCHIPAQNPTALPLTRKEKPDSVWVTSTRLCSLDPPNGLCGIDPHLLTTAFLITGSQPPVLGSCQASPKLRQGLCRLCFAPGRGCLWGGLYQD